jgi:hypothetical protein
LIRIDTMGKGILMCINNNNRSLGLSIKKLRMC